MSTPTLSIGIPTYNRVGALRNAVACLLPEIQTAGATLFISDNGSTDATSEFIAALVLKYPTMVSSGRFAQNRGIDANIDAVVRGAPGEYVWVCSDDDL